MPSVNRLRRNTVSLYCLTSKKTIGVAGVFVVGQGKNPQEYLMYSCGFSTQPGGKKAKETMRGLLVKLYIKFIKMEVSLE